MTEHIAWAVAACSAFSWIVTARAGIGLGRSKERLMWLTKLTSMQDDPRFTDAVNEIGQWIHDGYPAEE